MMKFSKTLFLWLGIIAVVAFIGLMVYDVIMINQLHAVASAMRSTQYQGNPRNWVLLASGLGVLAGFLLGISLGMPSKSFKSRYEELRASEATARPSTDQHRTDPEHRPEA